MKYPEWIKVKGEQMTYHGILLKLDSNHNNLRTDSIHGKFSNLPAVGESFVMVSEPLDEEAAIRYIQTSIVQEISFFHSASDLYSVMTFKTANSLYKLTF